MSWRFWRPIDRWWIRVFVPRRAETLGAFIELLATYDCTAVQINPRCIVTSAWGPDQSYRYVIGLSARDQERRKIKCELDPGPHSRTSNAEMRGALTGTRAVWIQTCLTAEVVANELKRRLPRIATEIIEEAGRRLDEAELTQLSYEASEHGLRPFTVDLNVNVS